MKSHCPQWLCPQHRDRIRHDPEAAVQLWRQLHSSPELIESSDSRLQLARWHVALEIIDALLDWRWPDTHQCLLIAARELIPGTLDDGCLLLRLHELLTRAVQGHQLPRCPTLTAWLVLLEHHFLRGAPANDALTGGPTDWH